MWPSVHEKDRVSISLRDMAAARQNLEAGKEEKEETGRKKEEEQACVGKEEEERRMRDSLLPSSLPCNLLYACYHLSLNSYIYI